MTSDAWYETVAAGESLTQGDIILRCPLLVWQPTAAGGDGEDYSTDSLFKMATAYLDDVIVLTQACDLEHGKVDNVVLCPHVPLSRFREVWEQGMKGMKQTPWEKAWKRTCRDIAGGHIWNHTFLNKADDLGIATEVRVVDFRDVFTIPRAFLEGMLRHRNENRLRLLPPYREHLSQAFARFFMRVGLPQPVESDW